MSPDTLIFLVGLAAPVAAYSPSAAVNYANTYWNNYNWPRYEWYPKADCANFVSQIMNEGGICRTSTWIPYTSAWASANSLKNYVKNNLGATKLSSGWMKVGQYNSVGTWLYGYVNNSANIPNTGDVVIFYDWNHDAIMDHTSYCVGTGYPTYRTYMETSLMHIQTIAIKPSGLLIILIQKDIIRRFMRFKFNDNCKIHLFIMILKIRSGDFYEVF